MPKGKKKGKGNKSKGGASKKRQVMKLEPVTYKLTLIYLGDKRIKRAERPASANTLKPGPYRCRYSLLARQGDADGSDLAVSPMQTIPNVVRNGETDAAAIKAAKPRADGGDNGNPPKDKVYKVMILDNHGTRTAENLTLLGDDGDAKSNVTYYKERGWLPDVMPAVPFRIIVRKFVGKGQVDMDEGVKAIVEVKDSTEEFAQNDGRRRNFTEEFFKKYNLNTGSASTGDDNAPKPLSISSEFAREAGGPTGVKATTVLKKLKYASPPEVDQTSDPLAEQPFADLNTAGSAGTMNARFELSNVLETSVDTLPYAGVADFGFCPWPGGGDNYRFLITLVKENKDVRDLKANGLPIELTDDQGKKIEKPKAYTTGRFVIWRKIEFALCVAANALTENDIRWNSIIAMYRKCFIEVTKPAIFFDLTRQAWKRLLRKNLPTTPDYTAVLNKNSNWTQTIYEGGFYPPELRPLDAVAGNSSGNGKELIKTIARQAIANACKQLGTLPDPSSGDALTDQRDGTGCFMFLCYNADPVNGVVGSYMGDRVFWFQKPVDDGVANATSTCAHEFAHLRSIRHAHTSFETAAYLPDPGDVSTAMELQLVNPRNGNIFHLDHDGKDAYACLQAYTRGLDAEPCGLCSIHLRFYDRAVIQSNSEFRASIDKRYGPVGLAILMEQGGNKGLMNLSGLPELPMDLSDPDRSKFEIVALGPEVDFTLRDGTNQKGRLNLTWYRKDEFSKWSLSNGSIADLAVERDGTAFVCIKVEAKAAGVGVLSYQFGGTTVSINVKVT